jgi:hypothetical protein
MKNYVLRFIYCLGLIFALMFFLGCGSLNVSFTSNKGFRHETSVRVPFSPLDDPVATLYCDDEGNAIFTKHIEIFHGHVNPPKEYQLEIFVVDKYGTVKTEKFGPYEATKSLDSPGNFIALGG